MGTHDDRIDIRDRIGNPRNDNADLYSRSMERILLNTDIEAD